MATYRSTWEGNTLESLAKRKITNPRRFMNCLYWDALEIDSHTARQLAKESMKHYPKIARDLSVFRKAMIRLQDTLIDATKNSTKY